MVALAVFLVLLVALVVGTVWFVQWMKGTGPFDRNPVDDPRVGDQRRALRQEIHEGRQRREDPHAGTTDLNDEWMASEGFGPPGAEGTDRRR